MNTQHLEIVRYKNKKFYVKGGLVKKRILLRNPKYMYRCGYVNMDEIQKYLEEGASVKITCFRTGADITHKIFRSLAIQNLKSKLNTLDPLRLRYFALNKEIEL